LPYSFDELLLRWFDRHVAGRADDSLEAFGPILYNVLNDGRWRTAAAWPPPDAAVRQLFLGGASAPGRPGALAATASSPSAPPAADALVWHPASGACSRSSQQALIGLPPDNPCMTKR
jgi:predicted acyl esterase